jgi:hypothetical protein
MVSYTIHSLKAPTHITFCVNGLFYKEINIKQDFPKYVVPDKNNVEKYYIDIETNELVYIENAHKSLKSLRGPTLGNINQDGKYYRPAIQSDIDKNEEKYDSENWKLYKYFEKYCSSYEIFLSEDTNISVHIRKSEDGKDIVLERYIKENGVFHRKECVNLDYAVRELQYCEGETLREKYSELIYKNLEIPILRDSLMSYVNGVFKVKQERYGSYDSDSDFDSD